MLTAAVAGLGAGGAKATLMLTVPLDALREQIGAAAVLGSAEGGCLLTPATARRIACDANLVPVLLGTDGELLDLGRTARLFSPAQARAVRGSGSTRCLACPGGSLGATSRRTLRM